MGGSAHDQAHSRNDVLELHGEPLPVHLPGGARKERLGGLSAWWRKAPVRVARGARCADRSSAMEQSEEGVGHRRQ
jgi:hypothetical protein